MDLRRCHERTITSPAGQNALKAVQTALRHFSGDFIFDHTGIAARRSFLTRRFFANWSMEVQMCLYIKTVVLDKRMGWRCPVCGVYPIERDYRRECRHLSVSKCIPDYNMYIDRKQLFEFSKAF